MLSLQPVLIVATHYCAIFLRIALLWTPENSEPAGMNFNWTPRCDHITVVLVNLHWLKVDQRIIHKIVILTFRFYVGLSASLYLREAVK